jgi:hypothetical protein
VAGSHSRAVWWKLAVASKLASGLNAAPDCRYDSSQHRAGEELSSADGELQECHCDWHSQAERS